MRDKNVAILKVGPCLGGEVDRSHGALGGVLGDIVLPQWDGEELFSRRNSLGGMPPIGSIFNSMCFLE